MLSTPKHQQVVKLVLRTYAPLDAQTPGRQTSLRMYASLYAQTPGRQTTLTQHLGLCWSTNDLVLVPPTSSAGIVKAMLFYFYTIETPPG